MNSIVPATYTKQKQIKKATSKEIILKGEDKHLTIVTDASVHKQEAAYAWVIAGTGGNIIVKKQEKIKEYNISSYRAEIMGILSAITYVKQAILNTQTTWELDCNNNVAIQRVTYPQQNQPSIEWLDSDILYAIKQNMQSRGSFYHVRDIFHQQNNGYYLRN
jgi:ribonuclease HI